MTETPQDHVHEYDEDGDCVRCGRDLFAGGEDGAAPEAAATAPVPEPGQADPFGGHEFGYEPHTDLFRCVRCHVYEVTARAEGTIKPCTGEPPAGSGPVEVNAW